MSLSLFRKATMARLFSSSHTAELVLILYASVLLCLRHEALMGPDSVYGSGGTARTNICHLFTSVFHWTSLLLFASKWLNWLWIKQQQQQNLISSRYILGDSTIFCFWKLYQITFTVSTPAFWCFFIFFIHVHGRDVPASPFQKNHACIFAHSYCNTCSILQFNIFA